MHRFLPLAASLLFLIPLAACSGDEGARSSAAEESTVDEPMRIWFESPVDGEVITGSEIRIVLRHSGVNIVPVDLPRAGEGHHHLFVNEDVTPMGEIIPANRPGIIHLGQAQQEHILEGLAPGEYRLIAVLADGMHVPMGATLVDTVHVVLVADGESPPRDG